MHSILREDLVGWFGRIDVLIALVSALLALAGCKSPIPEPEPLSLDEVLSPGVVRAGRIRRSTELLTGPTAKARIGDFKLYNDRVAVTVADIGHGFGFQSRGGTVLDADWLPGAGGVSAFGEIAVTFDFAGLEPERVELVSDGRDGVARVRATGRGAVLSLFGAVLGESLAPAVPNLEWSTDYVLEPNSNRLRMEHRVKNLDVIDVALAPVMGLFFGTGAVPFLPGRGFAPSLSGAQADYYAAASDAVSYIFGAPGQVLSILFGESGLAFGTLGPAVELRARESKLIEHWLLIGDGDLAKTEAAWRDATGAPADIALSGRVPGSGGLNASAVVHVSRHRAGVDTYATRTETDAEGRFTLELPAGEYDLIAVSKVGTIGAPRRVNLTEPRSDIELLLPEAGVLSVHVRDELMRPLPTKLSLIRGGEALPVLPLSFGARLHGLGIDRTEFIMGDGEVFLPAGTYRAYVSRGGEYEVHQEDIEVAAGTRREFSVSLSRSVDTSGWMSSEPHVHAQWSPDSRDSNLEKVRGMAAENIELPVSTDHEAVGDFGPAIRSLGLEAWLKGIIGTEISTIRYGHFNAFPLERDLEAPGFGRIDWFGQTPEQVFERVRARPEDPFLQVNHPRFESIGYFRLMKLERSTLDASAGFSFDFDGLEVINGCDEATLSSDPVQDWFALLASGRRVAATGSLDDHAIGAGAMGYPITYVRLGANAPREVRPSDLRDAYRAGRLTVSCGPFVEIGVLDSEIGDLHAPSGAQVDLRIVVRAPSWMDVDRAIVLVGGAVNQTIELPAALGTERLQTVVSVSLPSEDVRDTWVAVWVEGDEPHGVWAVGRRSVAFTNPIFLDRDHDGDWRP